MNESQVFERLTSACVVAVLVIDRAEDAVPVAEALLAGGVTAIELTLRTPAALDALRQIRRAVPGMLAGIGTVLTPDQVKQVIDAGGEFAVAPGMNPRVVEAALAAGLPFAPGICTPSDIERALEYDRRLLKFFPAEPSGGLAYLRAIAAPYAHLGLKYIPLGGLTISNMADYLREPVIGGIGGSWIAPRDDIRAGEWARITESAHRAIVVRNSQREARPA
ncbi:MAG: 2-dehydro-3-deoxyphosphogluconate aldolase [Chthoniobacteraceae bacterium]|nr:2-dehydro-3-deoxyphosphogluconate aldolase [Chthoniobacteraceae bacterium]